MDIHPSQFDKDWIIGNLEKIEVAIKEDNLDYAIGKIDGINEHLERTKELIRMVPTP
jgi:hypothetical protein